MTPDELLLFAIEDLDVFLELDRGEYDGLSSAWPLRKLLLNGRRSLVQATNVDREVELQFTVADIPLPDSLSGSVPLEPNDAAAAKSLSLQDFLRHPVHAWESDGTKHSVSVADLIAYIANVDGAVHVQPPNSAAERALWDFCWGKSRTTPQGQFTGGVYALIGVARVARQGLEPLRERVQGELWPDHLPRSARGLRRVRDPRNFGRPRPS